MSRVAKKVNDLETFQVRLNEHYLKHFQSQSELAAKLDVTRQTVGGWLNGQSIPDISILKKMAQIFGVSADYLLGLSDTESPDVSVQAAMAYTGLSEAAVERLHIGLDDFECDGIGPSDEEKKENLFMASALIQSTPFTKIIHNLNSVYEEAYLEKILNILYDRYTDCDSPEDDSEFCFKTPSDHNVVKTNLIHVFKTKTRYWEDPPSDPLDGLNDEDLVTEVFRALMSARDANERHQFHAAKEFNRVIDQLVSQGRQKAKKRFPAEKLTTTEK